MPKKFSRSSKSSAGRKLNSFRSAVKDGEPSRNSSSEASAAPDEADRVAPESRKLRAGSRGGKAFAGPNIEDGKSASRTRLVRVDKKGGASAKTLIMSRNKVIGVQG
jgi:hypothetical protein